MSRQSERERAGTIITNLGQFGTVVQGAMRTLSDRPLPVLSLISAGSEAMPGTRGGVAGWRHFYAATIYVACEIGSEGSAEATLDGLSGSVVASLAGTAGYTALATDAGATGAPLRDIDGRIYRSERITFEREEF